jgi:hypothetical protein
MSMCANRFPVEEQLLNQAIHRPDMFKDEIETAVMRLSATSTVEIGERNSENRD